MKWSNSKHIVNAAPLECGSDRSWAGNQKQKLLGAQLGLSQNDGSQMNSNRSLLLGVAAGLFTVLAFLIMRYIAVVLAS
jgi:hypothetical protein